MQRRYVPVTVPATRERAPHKERHVGFRKREFSSKE